MQQKSPGIAKWLRLRPSDGRRIHVASEESSAKKTVGWRQKQLPLRKEQSIKETANHINYTDRGADKMKRVVEVLKRAVDKQKNRW